MVNNISFAGRETLLTQPAKKVADPMHEYLGDGAIIKDTSVKVKQTVSDANEALNNAIKAKYAPMLEVPKTPAVQDIKVVDSSIMY